MNDTAPTTICIVGGDGSGKTTQVTRLAAIFESRGQKVAAVTIWDALIDPAVKSKLPFERPLEIYSYLKVLDPLARTHFLFHAMHLALDLARAPTPDVLLLNGYWYKYMATEIAHGGPPTELRQLAAGFAVPDRSFYLAITPEEALRRKSHRSDYESGYAEDPEVFLAFQRQAHQVLDTLSAELSWVHLDGLQPTATLTQAIVDNLDKARNE